MKRTTIKKNTTVADETSKKKKEVGRLTDMDTREVSIVDRAANKRTFLVVKRDEEETPVVESESEETSTDKAEERTEDGVKFPASAYAYVPDSTKPSTWKLRLYETPADARAGKPSVTYTAAAAQALSPAGFRGNRVQIPAADLPGVKSKVKSAWLKARADRAPEDRQLPAVLKQETSTDMADTETVNSIIFTRVEEALDRVDAVKAALECAEVSKDAGDCVPTPISNEIRCVQYMLKSLAGVTTKSVFLIPLAGDLTSVGSVTETVKANSIKVLDEVRRRLTALKSEVLEADILDAGQIMKLDSAADMLAQIPVETAKSIIVLRSSLDDEQRTKVLSEIEKTMVGLGDLFLSLQTNGTVSKSAHVADAFQVCSFLDGYAEDLEKAIVSVLVDKNDDKGDLLRTAIADIRSIQKGVGADEKTLADLAEPLRKVSVIAKAAGMFHARWRDGGAGDVVLTYPEEKVAEFETYQAAEAQAFKMNVQAVLALGLMKSDDALTFEVKKNGDKDYEVFDSNGVSVWKGEDVVEAAQTASRMNLTGTAGETAKNEDEVGADKGEAETKKVGRPMAAKKLDRFKDAVKLLKEAIADAATGSLSMEKFAKGIDSLGTLVEELQVAKRISDHQDPEGDRGTDQNVGSGSQPDTSKTKGVDEVLGEGTPAELKSILKRVENLEESGSEKDKLIAKLRSQVKTMKQVRSAPSTVPGDEDTRKPTKKDEFSDSVAWPADMNSYTGK